MFLLQKLSDLTKYGEDKLMAEKNKAILHQKELEDQLAISQESFIKTKQNKEFYQRKQMEIDEKRSAAAAA